MALVALVTACNAAVAVAVVAKLCASPLEHPLNAAQASVALAYVVALLTWLEAELALLTGLRTSFSPVQSGELASVLDAEEEADDSRSLDDDQPASRSSPAPISETAMRALRAAAELSALMVLLYICDRTTLVGRGPKHASKLEFWGVFSLLCLASLLGARRTHEAADAEVKPLQREQTEEWKGWMQVMFLLYHYWMATEMYNAIRIYIAAYIWMTGFGNFSYYYTKGDFAMPRFVQMMWRLNFLVAFVCLTLNNEYMLYYICPLHTLFTIMVYATLRLGAARNQSAPRFLLGKLCGALLVSCILWDVPGIFDALSAPFTPLLRYSGDLFQSTRPPLHEWHFRSSLDHLVWIFGMGVAYTFPPADRWLNRLDTDAGSNPLLRCARGRARRGAPRAQSARAAHICALPLAPADGRRLLRWLRSLPAGPSLWARSPSSSTTRCTRTPPSSRSAATSSCATARAGCASACCPRGARSASTRSRHTFASSTSGCAPLARMETRSTCSCWCPAPSGSTSSSSPRSTCTCPSASSR